METEAQQGNPRPILRVRGLTKQYWASRSLWRKRTSITALDNVSLEISPGKILGLVGSSGSGKSTLARCVTRLEKPDAGEIWIGETDIAHLPSRDLLPYRSRIQMIFQDPTTAMNPRMSAAEIVQEPLLIQRRETTSKRRLRIADLMREVGLSPDWMHRRVTDFSGGQRQRIAIARALTIEPKLLVLDEALTGLDLSTQAQIANLLLDLQASRSLTYLLISHDFSLVAGMADTIAVMSSGQIVEKGPTQEIMSTPADPVTRALLSSATNFRAKHAAATGGSV
jgi:ABC-type glutathione transport system ATPase component